MKVLKMNDSVNFVDDNNVLVGYDMKQECCEQAGWFISDKLESDMNMGSENDLLIGGDNDRFDIAKKYGIEADTEGFNFYKGYHKFITIESSNKWQLEDINMVVFQLYSGSKRLFLHLFNSHNGYYSHGFEVKHCNEIIVKCDL